MEFSKKLYELRKQKGLSQEELAGKLNVSRQTVSKWELGESTPEMEKLTALSDYFEISLDELVMGKEKEPSKLQDKSQKTVAQVLEEKILTQDNKRKTKKGFKIAGILFAIVLGIDLVSMIIYFAVCGIPK